MTASPSQAPHGVSATGVQRAIGERRRRRERERGGHVDLDATMSSWPSPDPPARARPVVRPRRAVPGSATAPALPTPQALLVREHTESAPRGSTPVAAGRRGRRPDGPGAPQTGPTGGSPFGPVGPAAMAAGAATAAAAASGTRAGGVGAVSVAAAGGMAAGGTAAGGTAAGGMAAGGTAVAARTVRLDRPRRPRAPEPMERRAPGDPGLRVVTHAQPRATDPAIPDQAPSRAQTRAQTRTGGPVTDRPGPPTGETGVLPGADDLDQSDPFRAFAPRPQGAAVAGRRPPTAPTSAATVAPATAAAPPAGAPPARARGRSLRMPITDPAADRRIADRPPTDRSAADRPAADRPATGRLEPDRRLPADDGTGPLRVRRRDRDGRGVDGAPAPDEFEHPGDGARGARALSGVRGSFAHLAESTLSRSRPSALDERLSRRPSATVIGAVVAGVVALVVVAALFLRPGDGNDPATALVAPEAPQQDTVLVTLIADDQTVSRALLLAVGPAPTGSGDRVDPVLVPGDLTVPVPDAGSLPFSQSITVDPQAPDRAVEDVLGVRVDGTWVMDAGLLADHVDTAGGVEVDVATAVVAGDVTVPVGTGQLLTGAQAAVYATAPVEGEAPEALLARFSQVVLGLVEAVPQAPGEVTQWLSQVDRHPGTTATSEQLSRVLAEASTLIAAQGVPSSAAVPTTGGDGSPLVADREAVEALVAERLTGARLPESVVGPLDVVVGNAVGDPGLVTAARDRLVEAGFRFAGGGTVEGETSPGTTVLVPEDTPENRERGLAVAAALGVSGDALFVKEDFTADVPEGTDIIVWLGEDYVADGSGEGGEQ